MGTYQIRSNYLISTHFSLRDSKYSLHSFVTHLLESKSPFSCALALILLYCNSHMHLCTIRVTIKRKVHKHTNAKLMRKSGSVVQSYGFSVVSISRSIQLLIRHSMLVKIMLYTMTSNIMQVGTGGSDSRTVGRNAEQATINVAMLAMRPPNPKSWKKMASVITASSSIGRKIVRTVLNGYRYIFRLKQAYCQFLIVFFFFFSFYFGINSVLDEGSCMDTFFFSGSQGGSSFKVLTYLAYSELSARPYSPKSSLSCKENFSIKSFSGQSMKFILTLTLTSPSFHVIVLKAKEIDSSSTSKGVRNMSQSISRGNLFLHWTVYSDFFSLSEADTFPSSRLRWRLGSGSRLQNISLLIATSRFFLMCSTISGERPLQYMVRITVALISPDPSCTSNCVIFLKARRRQAGRKRVFLSPSVSTSTLLLNCRLSSSLSYFICFPGLSCLVFFLSLLILVNIFMIINEFVLLTF